MKRDLLSTRRLPPGTRLGAAHLRIADIDRSLEFYQGLLGLRVVDRDGGRCSISAEPDGEPFLVLHEVPGTERQRARKIGLYHFAILLPERSELAQVLHRLLRVRWRILGASDHGISEALYLSDPDGIGLEISVDRPAELWRWEDDMIVMRTFPLDIPAMILDFRAEFDSWKGLIAGTRFGHVHFHVSDLKRAEAFYSGLLGLDVTARHYKGALFFAADGYHHHIGVNTWANTLEKAPAGTAGLIAYEIVIPDEDRVRTIRDNAERQGWRVLTEAGVLRIEDEDGNQAILRSS